MRAYVEKGLDDLIATAGCERMTWEEWVSLAKKIIAMDEKMTRISVSWEGGLNMTVAVNQAYCVRIERGLAYIGNVGPMNRETLLSRSENISKRRHEYVTEEAWRKDLNSSTMALDMLDSSLRSTGN